ncbi:MAG: tetratricopeptide repeat protein, partial [Gammaproteobacteria bacterium]|nr:tetratricopeptide repeat protein [Gammaproteobacteria bacterium]
NLMAEMLLSENDVQGAKAILDEVLEEYTENHNALELRGKAALIEKDYKSAVNYLRTASKLQPDRADLSKILAQAHFYLNEYELAENILMNAIKSNPKSVDSRINYAEYLLTQKRDADAKKVIHDARAFNKTDYSLQRFALKLAVADKDVKMQETILDEMKNTNKDNRDVYINRGNYYLAHNKYDKALEEFNLALERSATPPDVIVSLEMIARVYVAQNKLSDAIKYMEQRIESNSRDILSRFVLANIYLANKDRPNAKKYYMSVIDIGYKWPKPYTVLASIYSREENVDQAIELLKKGIEATDGDVSLKINLAGYYEAQNKFNDAMKVYEEVLVNDPLNMIALNNLASILLDQSSETNSIDRALAYAKKLNIEQNVAFKDTLGWAYAKSGDYKKSIELIKPIADQSPEILIFQYHLGYSLYHNGQKDEAKSYLEKVVNSSVSFSGKEAAKELFKSI